MIKYLILTTYIFLLLVDPTKYKFLVKKLIYLCHIGLDAKYAINQINRHMDRSQVLHLRVI